MNIKIRCVLVSLILLSFFGVQAIAATIQYTVVSGDTLWKISQNYKVSVDSIKTINSLTSDSISVGQKLQIPSIDIGSITYTVASGDTLWTISLKFKTTVADIKKSNNLTTDAVYVGQLLSISAQQTPQNSNILPLNDSVAYTVSSGDTLWLLSQRHNTTVSAIKYLNNLQSDSITIGQLLTITAPSNINPYNISAQLTHIEYINYIVKAGDNSWSIGQQFKIPYQEILNVNNLAQSSNLNLGQVLKIPIHIVPVKQTPGQQYGELLDWWTEAQYVFYTGATAKVTDFYTGNTFYIKRTIGANHADCETLTANDTSIMKNLWGGSWQWTNRPVIIEVYGRKIAASMAGMPHAGLDTYPALANIDNRSGGYGLGPNFDFIKGNNMDGHFDVHFLNSTRHNSGTIDPDHQAKIHIAAGQ